MQFSEEQIRKAIAAKSAEELLEMAKAENLSLTEEEAEHYFKVLHADPADAECMELSEEEQENVAGGSQCVGGKTYSSDFPYYLITTAGNSCPGYEEGEPLLTIAVKVHAGIASIGRVARVLVLRIAHCDQLTMTPTGDEILTGKRLVKTLCRSQKSTSIRSWKTVLFFHRKRKRQKPQEKENIKLRGIRKGLLQNRRIDYQTLYNGEGPSCNSAKNRLKKP